MPLPRPRRPLLPARAGMALALALAGCGGGVYIGWNDDDSQPPSVSIVASSLVASPGEVVRLTAAASDDFGIDHVSFFRDDGSSVERLGRDDDRPYEWEVRIPAGAGGSSIAFFARAVDEGGNARDSSDVVVQIVP